MDRSWMTKELLSNEYREGVQHFLNVAKDGATDLDSIRCPCTKCQNLYKLCLKDIRMHLTRYGIDPSYTIWKWHGDDDPSEMPPNYKINESIYKDDEDETLNDVARTIKMVQSINEPALGDTEGFQKLLANAKKPLYKGCTKYTKLSAIVKLFNIKAKSGWSEKSFSKVLALLSDMLPEDNELPLSTIEAKHILSTFGMGYQKIHACPNDCILYRNEYEDSTTCPTCEVSRYKVKKNTLTESKDKQNKGVLVKGGPPTGIIGSTSTRAFGVGSSTQERAPPCSSVDLPPIDWTVPSLDDDDLEVATRIPEMVPPDFHRIPSHIDFVPRGYAEVNRSLVASMRSWIRRLEYKFKEAKCSFQACKAQLDANEATLRADLRASERRIAELEFMHWSSSRRASIRPAPEPRRHSTSSRRALMDGDEDDDEEEDVPVLPRRSYMANAGTRRPRH